MNTPYPTLTTTWWLVPRPASSITNRTCVYQKPREFTRLFVAVGNQKSANSSNSGSYTWVSGLWFNVLNKIKTYFTTRAPITVERTRGSSWPWFLSRSPWTPMLRPPCECDAYGGQMDAIFCHNNKQEIISLAKLETVTDIDGIGWEEWDHRDPPECRKNPGVVGNNPRSTPSFSAYLLLPGIAGAL